MLESFIGLAVHEYIATHGGGLQEQRLTTSVNGWCLSGAFDYATDDGLIYDWKVASVKEIEQGVKESRELQLNCYAHLASVNGIEVKGLRVGFILIDWSKVKAKNTTGYPPIKFMDYPIPLWTPTVRQAFIEERVRLHQAARVSLPNCTDKERWAKLDSYAVIKNGGKRASKVFGSSLDAGLYAKAKGTDYSIQVRAGESIRCAYYCPVAQVCEQWQKLK
jgi:hypothetical protein